MNKYEKRTQQKKKAIIQAALTLFGQRGFSAINIKEIAFLANVSQVSIYNYFGSKEALVYECAKMMMEETSQLAEDILATDAPFLEKLEQALDLCNAKVNQLFTHYLSNQAIQDEAFIRMMTKQINQIKTEIYLKYINYGKAEHIIQPTLSNQSIQLFIEAINYIGQNPSKEAYDQKEMIQLFLYGLIGK